MSNSIDELGDNIANAVTTEVAAFLENQDLGGMSREEVIELVEARIGEAGGGEIPKEAIKSAVREELERLGIPRSKRELDFPARREGPTKPSGPHHQASRWGIHFTTGTDCFIRDATVGAGESGTFTAVLAEYDGEAQFDVVDQRDIDVDEGTNRIDLNFQVPEAGEYLLTREGDFPLARDNYAGWKSYPEDNLHLIGGAKPGDYDDNQYWYYYFDLVLTAGPDHEFPESLI